MTTCCNDTVKRIWSVAVTVCDRGANRLKALKHSGVSEKNPIVRFQNQETAVIFDPPRLLKFAFNLFLKHDVANVECVITANGKRLTGSTEREAY